MKKSLKEAMSIVKEAKKLPEDWLNARVVDRSQLALIRLSEKLAPAIMRKNPGIDDIMAERIAFLHIKDALMGYMSNVDWKD